MLVWGHKTCFRTFMCVGDWMDCSEDWSLGQRGSVRGLPCWCKRDSVACCTVNAERANQSLNLFGMCEHGSNMGEVWELLTGLKWVLKGKHWPQKLRSLLLCFNCTQLYHFHGGFDCSSKTTRLLHKKTGLHISTVGILLLRLGICSSPSLFNCRAWCSWRDTNYCFEELCWQWRKYQWYCWLIIFKSIVGLCYYCRDWNAVSKMLHLLMRSSSFWQRTGLLADKLVLLLKGNW